MSAVIVDLAARRAGREARRREAVERARGLTSAVLDTLAAHFVARYDETLTRARAHLAEARND